MSTDKIVRESEISTAIHSESHTSPESSDGEFTTPPTSLSFCPEKITENIDSDTTNTNQSVNDESCVSSINLKEDIPSVDDLHCPDRDSSFTNIKNILKFEEIPVANVNQLDIASGESCIHNSDALRIKVSDAVICSGDAIDQESNNVNVEDIQAQNTSNNSFAIHETILNERYRFSWEMDYKSTISTKEQIKKFNDAGLFRETRILPTYYRETISKGAIQSSLIHYRVQTFTINFYTFIQDKLWKQLSHISLRIGGKYWNEFITSYGSFQPIYQVWIKDELFTALFLKLHIPIFNDIQERFQLSYKYYLLFKSGESSFEELYFYFHVKMFEIFNRCLYIDLDPINKLNGKVYTRYDLIILPSKDTQGIWRKVEYGFQMLMENIVPHQSFKERMYISMIASLPNYFGMGKSFETCNYIEEFFEKFIFFRDEYTCNQLYSYGNKNDNIINPIGYNMNHEKRHLSTCWIRDYLFPLFSEQKDSLTIFVHVSLTLLVIDEQILFEDTNLMTDFVCLLLNIVDRGIKHAPFQGQFREIDKSMTSIHRFFVTFILKAQYIRLESCKFIKLFPFYQCMFYFHQDFTKYLFESNYLTCYYWGVPEFYSIYNTLMLINDVSKILFNPANGYNILPYTILFFSPIGQHPELMNSLNIPYSNFLKIFLYYSHTLRKKSFTSTMISSISSQLESRTICLTQIVCSIQKEYLKIPLSEFDLIFDLSVALLLETEPFLKSLDPKYIITLLNLISRTVSIIYECNHDSIDNFHQVIKKRGDVILYLNMFCKNKVIVEPFQIEQMVEEFERWEIAISLEFPNGYNWEKEIGVILRARLSTFPPNHIFSIICNIHSERKFYSQFLQNILIEEVSNRISQCNPAKKEAILHSICSSELNPDYSYSRLFSHILLSQKDGFCLQPFTHLIECKLWLVLFPIFFSEKSKILLNDEALSFFENTVLVHFFNIISRIFSFSILPSEINCYHLNRDSFFELLSKAQPFLTNEKIKYEEIKHCINISYECYAFLNEQLKLLQIFELFSVEICMPSLDIPKDKFINQICLFSNDQFEIVLDPNFNRLVQSEHFKDIVNCDSEFLHSYILKYYIEHKSEELSCQIFEFGEFISLIWTPIIDELESLLVGLSNLSISFSLIKQILDIKELKSELTIELIAARNGIFRLKSSYFEIGQAVEMIPKLFTLTSLSQIIGLITSIWKRYKFTGDFSMIQRIEDTIQRLDTLKLVEIPKDVFNKNNILTALDEHHRDFLYQFNISQEFVCWIKENLKDIKEIKSFVDLASTTCGENPTDIDRITCLLTVCTELQPLIYLPENTDLSAFINELQNLTPILAKNRKLPTMLRDVSRSLSLWKDLINAKSSIEENTMFIIDKILTNGILNITLLPAGAVVELFFEEYLGDRRVLNFDQLNEYLSKFMLLSQGSNSSTTKYSHTNLDIFPEIFEKVVIFFKELNNLHKLAHPDYVSFSISIPFNEGSKLDDEIAIAQSKLKIMEDCIISCRQKEYFLSYFTTSQLVYIKRLLNSMLIDKEFSEDQRIFHLLSIVNPAISKSFILHTIKWLIEDERVNLDQSASDGQAQDTVVSKSIELTEEDLILSREVKDNNDFTEAHIHTAIRELKKKANISENAIIRWCTRNSESKLARENVTMNEESNIFTEGEIVFEDIGFFKFENFTQVGAFIRLLNVKSECLLKGERIFPDHLVLKEPNLILLPKNEIFNFSIFLYSLSEDLPLPFPYEILICEETTTCEELDIFWKRALTDNNLRNYYHIYCVLHAEKLTFETSKTACNSLIKYLSDSTIHSRYKLVILCSEEQEQHCYMASALEKYKKLSIREYRTENISKYLSNKLCKEKNPVPSSLVKPDYFLSRLVISTGFGAGKSLFISKIRSQIRDSNLLSRNELNSKIISLYGNQICQNSILNQLVDTRAWNSTQPNFYHIDISSTIQHGIESLLFKLIVLGCITNTDGFIWNRKNTDFYVFELTMNLLHPCTRQFIQQFPHFSCFQPKELLNQIIHLDANMVGFDDIVLSKIEYQRVYSYLRLFEGNGNLDSFVYDPDIVTTDYPSMVQVFISQCGIHDPSWTEISYFIEFLNKQLVDCEKSSFCQMSAMGDEWSGFKSFVLRLMIHMSRDFATPSLERSTDSEGPKYKIIERRKWENSSHPYIFFNPDGHTMTFLGFWVDGRTTNLLNSDNTSIIIEKKIMSRELYLHLQINGVNLNEKFEKLGKKQLIQKLTLVMGCEHDFDPDPNYVITLDNARKILGIHMRFRCNIPVIIMGETGCGKTHLVEYMCALQAYNRTRNNLLIMKIHGGTTENEIIDTVNKAQIIAKSNKNNFDIDTIVFFDEANTSPNVSLIKEIMCDHRIRGEQISQEYRLQFIAACNPYKRHSDKMIKKLNQAGLGYYKNFSSTIESISGIPLRDLVYRVMELPESLGSLVWDFGTLNQVSEYKYIIEMVTKYIFSTNFQDRKLIRVISVIICEAQSYMRCRDDECSYVSLRDVDRTMRVMLWFFKNLEIMNPEIYSPSKEQNRITNISDANASIIGNLFDDISESESVSSSNLEHVSFSEFDILTTSVILALSICYRSRLQERDEFDVTISRFFQDPLQPILNSELISKIVDKYYKSVFEDMIVGTNIAANHALKENIFMMFVCTELKIPLFIVGKPGSSKSLSKTIISDSMQGNRSLDGSILTHFKQVHMISYQCSHLSTSEGIIDVFAKCAAFQKGRNPNQFVSCVVLDEVGLAEDSPKLPLKVLHPLLDDSIYIHQNIVQTDLNPENDNTNEFKLKSRSEEDMVAFIGISNWALDPAKMNRGIMLIRDDPKIDQLISTAKGILDSDESKKFKLRIKDRINQIADSYLDFLSSVRESFCTSKDFYGLRDFYSLIKMLVFLCKKYNTKLNPKILEHSILRNFSGMGDINPLEYFDIKRIAFTNTENNGPDSNTLALIKASLTNYESTFYGENRYLLLLTENLAALDIFLSSPNIWPSENRQDIRVLFGSSFPDDQDYSVICRNINKIKVYMETGKTVILINLDNLYESLYDALNQYYMHIYGNRYIDLGLGTHRVKCKVHDNFKLIIIADKQTVFQNFPSPLINRLEKHTLMISTILPDHVAHLEEKLIQWALSFSTPIDTSIRKRSGIQINDCFIGYQPETPATIVYNVLKEMDESYYFDEKHIFDRSKSLLLKLATVDAVLRLQLTNLRANAQEIESEYFDDTKTTTLEDYLRKVLKEEFRKNIYFIHATTHSRLLNENDKEYLSEQLETSISVVYLQQFRTNHEFVKEIMNLVKFPENENYQIIIIQSENGELNKDLITSVRYTSYQELSEWRERSKSKCKIFLVILTQLQKRGNGSEFSSYHGRDVDSIHIDTILNKDNILPPIQDLSKTPLHELFSLKCEVLNKKTLLAQCIQPSISCIYDCFGSDKRSSSRIVDTVNIFQEEKYCKILSTIFHKISNALANLESDDTQNWIKQASTCWDLIQSSGSFKRSLITYIYRAIIPIFAELLALLDRNGNLKLYRNQEEYPEKLNYFWEIVFSNEVFIFSIEDTYVIYKHVPMQNDGADGQFFQAFFPFSWLIFKNVSEIWYTACLRERKTVTIQRFQSLFDNTPIGQLVNDILMKDAKSYEYMMYYLHDFIRMSLPMYDEDQFKIYEVILQSYFDLLKENTEKSIIEASVEEQSPCRINISIPLIHFSYHELTNVFSYLHFIFSYNRGISRKLAKELDIIRDDPKNFRNLYRMEHLSMELMISYCTFDENKVSNPAKAEEFTQDIRSYNELFMKGLHLDRSNCIPEYQTFKDSLQSRWDEILVISLFISKISLKKGLKFTTKSLSLLRKLLVGANFSSDDPMEDIVAVVCKLYESAKTSEKYKNEGDKFLVELGDCITEFLRYVITTVVLKYQLDEKLVIYLTRFITLSLAELSSSHSQQPKESTIKNEFEYIPPYHLKMFVLHLLLRKRPESVMPYFSHNLEDLTTKASDAEKKNYLENIYLMIIYSIEDSHFYTIEEMPVGNQIEYANELLGQLNENSLSQANTLNVLKSIAIFRFLSLFITHFLLFTSSSKYSKHQNQEFVMNFKRLIELNCHEEPHTFFYKAVYQLIGFDLFLKTDQFKHLSWIIPEARRSFIQVISPDVYSIYGKDYEEIHLFSESCLFKGEIPMEETKFEKKLLVLSLFDCALNIAHKNSQDLPMSYDKAFLSIINADDTDYMSDDTDSKSDIPDSQSDIHRNVYLRMKTLIFQKFLNSNEHKSENIAIARLLYHLGIVLISHTYPKIFYQIALIYLDPESAQNTYFPTMEDSGSNFAKEFSQIRNNITGNWYTCKNGHIYFIGECGRAWTVSRCPECNENIGGIYHHLFEDNVCITQDLLGTGYTLKNHSLKNIFYSERPIPPIAIIIIHILLHSTFLFSSMMGFVYRKNLKCLFSTLKIENSPIDFFTQRLAQDITHLKILTQKNCDEALLCIHLILRDFLNTPPIHFYDYEDFQLNFTTEERDRWEINFHEQIIQPALIEANDSENPNNQLYGKFNYLKTLRDSPFWENRSVISIESFKLAFLSQSSGERQKFSIQNKLIRQDNLLLATKHLPKIIRLRAMLMKDFGFRVNKDFTMKTTFKDLVNSFPTDNNSVVDEYIQCSDSLFEALKLAGEDLYNHGRIPIKRDEVVSINGETPVIYFLPTSAKESSSVTSLIDLLVCIHNSFVHEYENKETSYKAQKINLSNVQDKHMITFQEDLLPLILSNVNYPLNLSERNTITYRFHNIEEEFGERFIRMAPIIMYEVPQFQYKRESYDPNILQRVKDNVVQDTIDEKTVKFVIETFDSIDAISEILALIDVIIGFLASAGANPTWSISKYITDVLCYEDIYSTDIKEVIKVIHLTHLLHFWNILSFEKAKKMALNGQDSYGYLDDFFFQGLERETVDEINIGLNKYHVQTLLHQLHDFIQFKMRTMKDEMLEYSLRDCMKIYSEDNEILLPEGFLEFFPESPKISQTIAVWTVLTLHESEAKK